MGRHPIDATTSHLMTNVLVISELTHKPGSVQSNHLSGTIVTDRLKQPTRIPNAGRAVHIHAWIPIWPCSEWGLPCHECYHPRGELLPHPFTLTSQCEAVCFLLHWPWACAPQALPGTLPDGARTFLCNLKKITAIACVSSGGIIRIIDGLARGQRRHLVSVELEAVFPLVVD